MAVPFVKCYNQTEAELGVFTDEHYPNGYRFTSLSIYGTLADPLYAAVMVSSDDPVAQVPTFNLDRVKLYELIESNKEEELTPAIISAMGTTADPRFAVIWERTNDPLASVLVDLTETALGNTNLLTRFVSVTSDQADGSQVLLVSAIPISLAVYGDPDDRRYALVLRTNSGAADWDCTGLDVTADEYHSRLLTQNYDHNRVALVSLASDGAVASVFRNDQVGLWVAPHHLTAQQLQQALTSYTVDEDYYPAALAATGSGAGIRFATIFAKSDQLTPRSFQVTGTAGPGDQYDETALRVMKDYGIHQAALALVHGTRLVLRAATRIRSPTIQSQGRRS